MTITYQSNRSTLIGAIELKRAYQKNMLLAETLILGLMALTILLVLILSNGTRSVVLPIPSSSWVDHATHVSIPPTLEKPLPTPPSLPILPSAEQAWLVEAAPDESVTTETVIADPTEYNNQIGADTSGTVGIIAPSGPDTNYPDPGVWVYREEEPVQVDLPTPKYPEMARRAGLEAEVWLNALVDIHGKVLKVIVTKTSVENAGFEAAAVEAAYKATWRPALQNSIPVAVWVSYVVKFRLR